MSVAIARHDVVAMVAGIIAMVSMIVLLDMCLWRPVLVWVQRFRLGDAGNGDVRQSTMLTWLQQSWLVHVATTRVAHPISAWITSKTATSEAAFRKTPPSTFSQPASLVGNGAHPRRESVQGPAASSG